jgi:hypothetical protein
VTSKHILFNFVYTRNSTELKEGVSFEISMKYLIFHFPNLIEGPSSPG